MFGEEGSGPFLETHLDGFIGQEDCCAAARQSTDGRKVLMLMLAIRRSRPSSISAPSKSIAPSAGSMKRLVG